VSIPFLDLAAQQREIADEIRPALDDLFERAAFIGGAPVAGFERAYAGFTRAAHCIGVGNGTDAIELALRALGIGAGDEVILPANTFIATAEAVVRAGATPVLVDVDPVYLLIDTDAVAAAITPATRAILPVHLYGQMAPMARLAAIASRHGLALVEDAAQSQGATQWGTVSGAAGVIAATSFYPGKNLGAAGDAGAVTTSDDGLARRVRLLSAHGSETKYVHELVGMNSRMDAVQAVVLSAKLARLERWNAARRAAAALYAEALAGLDLVLPSTAPGNVHAWHLYVVQLAEREAVAATLAADGISTGIHYPTPLHLTQAFADSGWRRGQFPVAEAAAARILSLPMFPHLAAAQIGRVAEALQRALDEQTVAA